MPDPFVRGSPEKRRVVVPESHSRSLTLLPFQNTNIHFFLPWIDIPSLSFH